MTPNSPPKFIPGSEQMGNEFWAAVNHQNWDSISMKYTTSTCEKDKGLARGKPPIYEIETSRLRRRVKKKRCRGANPGPMVLNASALPLHHSDLSATYDL